MLAEASQPYYQADSHVSPSLSQAAGRGQTTLDGFGLSISGSSESVSLNGLLLRMLQHSSVFLSSKESTPTFKRKVTKSGYTYYQLQELEHHTKENGVLLLPTPAATDYKRQEESASGSVCGSDIRRSDKTLDTDCQSGLQEDKAADTVRESRNARHSASRLSWSGISLPDWSGYPSRICRMDDGISHKLDKSRLQALGNAVVPRCVFPIFDAIRRIEQEEY